MNRAPTIFACAFIATVALAGAGHAQKLTDLETIGRLCAEETGAMEQKLLRCAEYKADPKKFGENIAKTSICKAVKRQCAGRHNARMHLLSTGLGCAERDFCYYVRR